MKKNVHDKAIYLFPNSDGEGESVKGVMVVDGGFAALYLNDSAAVVHLSFEEIQAIYNAAKDKVNNE